ncbi:MAG: nucleoside permease [Planctomycetota bacterium]
MSFSVRIRLSVMMFLQYFVWGAWFVTLGTYLGTTLKFEGSAIGMCYAAIPIAGMISPFFVGIIADRFFAAERLLAALHLIGAGLLYYVSTEPGNNLVFPILLCYALCYMPTLSLTNTVSFHEMRDPAKEFPGIRVWGTIGWIAAGMLIGKLRLSTAGALTLSTGAAADLAASLTSIEATSLPMKIAAFSSIILAIACLFLPHTPPKKDTQASLGSILGLDALRLMKSLSFSVFVIGSFLICIPLQFYYAFTNQFLNAVHMPDPAFTMTLGQVSEIVFMLIIPFFFTRLGVKYMLVVGMLAWTIRYFLFSVGSVPALYMGIILHGICYDFFFVTGQIYVDQKAPREMRGAAQGFIAFATLGFGQFIGSVIGGRVLDAFKLTSNPPTYDWTKFWLVPAFGAIIVLFLFTFLFNDRDGKPKNGIVS